VHSVKAVLPAGEFEYTGHDLQVELDEAPFASEYVCSPHSTHVPTVEAPTAVEYLPASHAMHFGIPISAAKLPGLHSEHCAVPKSFLNFPASQAVQAFSEPVVPGAHRTEQFEMLVVASGEFGRSAGQDEQFANPGTFLYVPIAHGLQSSFP
jgi:hypothetical protein